MGPVQGRRPNGPSGACSQAPASLAAVTRGQRRGPPGSSQDIAGRGWTEARGRQAAPPAPDAGEGGASGGFPAGRAAPASACGRCGGRRPEVDWAGLPERCRRFRGLEPSCSLPIGGAGGTSGPRGREGGSLSLPM